MYSFTRSWTAFQEERIAMDERKVVSSTSTMLMPSMPRE